MARINDYHRSCEVDFTIQESVDALRDQFNSAVSLFSELKNAATFIYDIGLKFGTSNGQIDLLKEKIDNLFLTLNESVIQASNKVLNDISQNAEALKNSVADASQNTSKALEASFNMPYEELFEKYNNALSKNVELEARITELANGFNSLQDKNSELNNQVERLQQENQELDDKLLDAQAEMADQVKENYVELPQQPESPIFLHNSSMRSNITQHDEFMRKAKTADDFIETFEKVFKSSDEVIQLLKHINPSEKDVQPIYVAQALEKARLLRQILNEVLMVFRKARINPAVLSSDVGEKVAQELQRIYKTLKTVKINTEKRKGSNEN